MRPPKGKFGIALFPILKHCELKITTYFNDVKKILFQNLRVLVPNIIHLYCIFQI